jgi:hypothetical protein
MDSSNQMGVLNDLWKFNTSSYEWTWIGGESVVDSQNPSDCFGLSGGEICAYPGVYGTKGTPAGTVAFGSSEVLELIRVREQDNSTTCGATSLNAV